MDPKQPSSGHEPDLVKPVPAACFYNPILFRPAQSESCVPGGLTDISFGPRHESPGRFFSERTALTRF